MAISMAIAIEIESLTLIMDVFELNVPSADKFRDAREKFIHQKEMNEQKLKLEMETQRIKDEIQSIELAFMNRDPSSCEISVTIHGKKMTLAKSVELSLRDKGYDISYYYDYEGIRMVRIFPIPPPQHVMNMVDREVIEDRVFGH